MEVIEISKPLPTRINSHSNLSEIVRVFKAPEVKETKQRGIQPWEKKLRTDYHIKRMKMFASKAQSPDMNWNLREIQTGHKDDKVLRAFINLSIYTLGVLFIFRDYFK